MFDQFDWHTLFEQAIRCHEMDGSGVSHRGYLQQKERHMELWNSSFRDLVINWSFFFLITEFFLLIILTSKQKHTQFKEWTLFRQGRLGGCFCSEGWIQADDAFQLSHSTISIGLQVLGSEAWESTWLHWHSTSDSRSVGGFCSRQWFWMTG